MFRERLASWRQVDGAEADDDGSSAYAIDRSGSRSNTLRRALDKAFHVVVDGLIEEISTRSNNATFERVLVAMDRLLPQHKGVRHVAVIQGVDGSICVHLDDNENSAPDAAALGELLRELDSLGLRAERRGATRGFDVPDSDVLRDHLLQARCAVYIDGKHYSRYGNLVRKIEQKKGLISKRDTLDRAIKHLRGLEQVGNTLQKIKTADKLRTKLIRGRLRDEDSLDTLSILDEYDLCNQATPTKKPDANERLFQLLVDGPSSDESDEDVEDD